MSKLSQTQRQWVRYFVDYSALAVFLVTFFLSGRNMTAATWGLVAGSAIALVVGLAVERRLAMMPLIAGGAALIFGALTLIFDDPRFIKIKPTVMNTLFALVLIGGLMLKKNPLKLLLGEALEMPATAWRRLTINYAVFFLALAGLNELVWRTQSDATWVLFRFPGLLVLTFAFSIAHAPLLMRYMKAGEAPPPPTE